MDHGLWTTLLPTFKRQSTLVSSDSYSYPVLNEQILFALEHSFNQVVGYDRDLRIVLWNKSAEEWFNVSKQDAIGKSITELFPSLKTDKRLDYLRRALEGEEFYLTGEKGTLRDAYYKQKILPWRDGEGHIVGALVIAQDHTSEILKAREIEVLNTQLTEQNRLLEERTRLAESIINASMDFISVLDKDQRFLAANKAYLQYIGKEASELIGRRLLDLYPQLEGTAQYLQIQAALAGEVRIIRDQAYTSRAGYCDIYLLPLTDESNEVYGLLSVTHDISALKEAYRKLESANQELEEKNDQLNSKNTELETLASLASSDFQEPINKVQVFAELLAEKESDRLSDTGRDYLRRLNKSLGKIRELLASLQYYQQLQNRSAPAESVELNALMARLEEELLNKHRDVRFTRDTLPPVNGNAHELYQLFHELLDNALKFRQPEGNLEITLTHRLVSRAASATQPRRTYLQLTLSDNGIGFEADHSDKVFELFFKIHSSHEHAGKGVGLAVCKKIVEKHKGSIEAHSEPLKGVSIIIELPFTSE